MKNTLQSSSINSMKKHAADAANMLKQLANTKRLLILCQLVDTKMSVQDLSDIVGLSQSALSQHLAKMRIGKLVCAEKKGKMVYYSLANMEARALLSVLHLIYCKK